MRYRIRREGDSLPSTTGNDAPGNEAWAQHTLRDVLL